MLRGDDVADLQQRLCALGFDTDRVDGIFGGLTAAAVSEFQENIGLVPDGKAGPATIEQLQRLGGLSSLTRSVTAVRDGELLRNQSGAERFKVIGLSALGDAHGLIDALNSSLQHVGIIVEVLHGDEKAIAARANALHVDLYLGLSITKESSRYRTLFYSGYTYESASGKALATAIMANFEAPQSSEQFVVGMALPLLRETLMTAVLVELPSSLDLFGGEQAVVRAVTQAITAEDGAKPGTANE